MHSHGPLSRLLCAMGQAKKSVSRLGPKMPVVGLIAMGLDAPATSSNAAGVRGKKVLLASEVVSHRQHSSQRGKSSEVLTEAYRSLALSPADHELD